MVEELASLMPEFSTYSRIFFSRKGSGMFSHLSARGRMCRYVRSIPLCVNVPLSFTP